MTVGPLRRLVGTLGLLALVPTAMMLALGRITPLDAALRATATLLAAMVIGRVAGWWVVQMARGYEDVPEATVGAVATPAAEEQPRRRRSDGGSAATAGA
jgi:hypothetical protein